jgi:DNA-binding transcriptional ArsR family regulator
MAILAVLKDGPATGSQIASSIGTIPANLTRHIRVLQDAGLVRLSYTRDTGRNLEKYYEAVADSFDVAPEISGLESPQKIALAFARSDISAAIAHLPGDDQARLLVLVSEARIPQRAFARFAERLQKLVKSFSDADRDDGEPYHLALGLYPGPFDLDAKKITWTAPEKEKNE